VLIIANGGSANSWKLKIGSNCVKTTCKQIKEEYEALQKNAAEFAVMVETIRKGGGLPAQAGDVRAANLKKKKLALERIAFLDKLNETFDQWAVAEFGKLIRKHNGLPALEIVGHMAGIKVHPINDLRLDFRGSVSQIGAVMGYAGVDSRVAWSERAEAWKEDKINRGMVLRTLCGLDSDEAWKYRDKILNGTADPELMFDLISGLIGVDSDRAWAVRDKFFSQNGAHYQKPIARSLAGLDTDRAWRMRKNLFGENLIKSVYGLNSRRAWEVRERFCKPSADFDLRGEVAESLVGLDTAAAWKMRHDLLAHKVWWICIMNGLAGVKSSLADEMRKKGLDEGCGYGQMLESINGTYSTAMIWRTARKQIGNS